MSTAARIDELRSKFDENPRRYFAPLANEYRKAGELEQAIALCREHLPKQPGHMSGHIVFGQALYESGELLEAQEIFEAALTLDPENLIALRHLGDIARARGDASLARRWYERVLDADPRNDDIASLLASLSQRLTPRSVTPQAATTAVDPYTGAPAYAESPEAVGEPADPFSAPDAPAWHTPSFLTPLATDVVSPAPEPVAEPQLLDLDFPGDLPEEVSAPVLERVPVEPAFDAALESFDEPSASVDDLADAFGEMRPDVSAASAELDVVAANMTDAGEATDPLAVALDAFASNDPFASDAPTNSIPDTLVSGAIGEASAAQAVGDAEGDAGGDAGIDAAHEDMAAASAVAAPESAFVDEHDDFEEGLVALEWPDASLINARVATPLGSTAAIEAEDAHETPISAEMLDEAFGAEAGVGDLDVAVAAVDEFEHENALVVDEAEVLTADALEESVPEPVAEAIETPVAEAIPEPVAETTEEPAYDEMTTDESWQEEEAEIEASILDEDPPLSVVEVPWLAVEEEEREADDVALSLDDAGHTDDVEEEAAAPTPAFVTETMAELFVAQGFLDRAVGVYEELVRRRPYDAVLSSRLEELRATVAAEASSHAVAEADEPASAPESWSAPTPLYGVTPVSSIAPLLSATPAWSSTPIRAGTPVQSATPVRAATPIASATPVRAATPIATPIINRSLTPASLPLIAPAPQRTARQFFAALAAVRVARRTPSFGSVAVASPTPADGLASLFGEVPMPRDDVAARSLAQAFGSGEQVAPGPSLFAPAEPEEQLAVGNAAPSAPASASAEPAAPAFSFDRFFPDPATAGSSATPARSGEGAPSGTSVIGSSSGSDSPAPPPSSAGADLAQFAHWLKGLSNS